MTAIGRVWRVACGGLAAALVVGLAGRTLERLRLGASEPEALARVQAEVRQRLDATAALLSRIADRVASAPDTIRTAPRDPSRDPVAARRLFETAAAALEDTDADRTGLTVYNETADVPLAWAGHVSELPKDRRTGPAALFVKQGTLGPRLVLIDPVFDRPGSTAARIGVIAVEQLLEHSSGAAAQPDAVVMPTSIVPVTLRVAFGYAAGRGAHTFVVPSARGGPLVESEVAPGDIPSAHAIWRRRTRAAVWCVLAVTALLCCAPVFESRRRTRGAARFLVVTIGLAGLLALVRVLLWLAARDVLGPRVLTSPADLLLDALLAAAIAWIIADLVERRRFARPRPRLLGRDPVSLARSALICAAAGAAGAGLLAAYERLLERIVTGTALDVLHFSLHPLNATRLALAFALVLLHAAVIWTAVAGARAPAIFRRAPRALAPRLAAAAGWSCGALLTVGLLATSTPTTPILPLLAALAAAGGGAVALAELRAKARRASQAARLLAFFAALLMPSIAMYPSLTTFAAAAKERLVAADLATQALGQREDLEQQLRATLNQIDAWPSPADLVGESVGATRPSENPSAFQLWTRTDLGRYRLTSAVELWANGTLVSRFSLNLPEYEPTPHQMTRCTWSVLGEPLPYGSTERHVLQASRAICDRGRRLGSIVVRVMLDYRTLPFIAAQNPYLEWFGLAPQPLPEGAAGRDVELVVYGWSRTPMYESGTSVWQLPDAVFDRMVASRAPFWVSLPSGNESFRVYCTNDRSGIYTLGYPTVTPLGHLVNLAELTVLVAVLCVALFLAATLAAAATSARAASGRALLREVRSSFYRKLFLAFVAAAVAPVAILALATRAYFLLELSSGIEDAAAKTVTVAQRLVEDYAALQQRTPGALVTIDDRMVVLVSRAINENVNVFNPVRLIATSERYLFVSQLLSERVPGDVFRAIVLDRLPTFVAGEQVGDFPYRLAAAPVRAGIASGLVTVPLTSRQQVIERQKDELDRRVVSAAVLFSLFGAALGYWMAQRIADPVNRLTRATRRIARGDLDVRVAATSSDELRRLVQDFNRMASDLKRQRADLERTQRLEAWAEMARQVAHDIKNPLTPIQLSAEHARRVNLDQGRPLSPALDDCVNAILTQVRLLRQIAAEFSSFASAPSARPAPTSLGSVVEEVVQPYRVGLAGRVVIDVDIAENLPSVHVDRTLFARALTNAIENALHAMPGKGRLIINARLPGPSGAPSPASHVVIDITDSGVGMDEAAAARVFEPYFSTKATGTGLGLTIARRNVELNGGTIAVRSQRGVGTTVTITLPVAPTPTASNCRSPAGGAA